MSAPTAKDRGRCAVLVPVGTQVEPDCDRALGELSARGYAVRRLHGNAAVDQARNLLASRALADGFEELFWIDADIGFDPDDVDELRAHGLPFVCGIYPKKGEQAVSCHTLPGTDSLVFGRQGGLVELRYAATGFLLTRREVYEAVERELALPRCNERFGLPIVPYFMPLIVPDGQGHWYLGEDYAFCERVRRAGYRIMADTRIRLFHIGKYAYCWEDAGGKMKRFTSFRLNIAGKPER